MKKFIAIITITFSLSAMALESTLMSQLLTCMYSEQFGKEEATRIINESQAFNQTGELSVFLSQKIKDVQTQYAVSDLEALDVLVQASEQALK